MNTVLQFISHPLVIPLGWTLLHFLWQGALIAACWWIVQPLLRKRPADTRYLAACAALFLMAAAPIATGLLLVQEAKSESVLDAGALTSVPSEMAMAPMPEGGPVVVPAEAPVLLNQLPLKEQMEAWLPSAVALWLAMVLALSLRLLLGYARVWRIRKEARESLGDFWENRILELAEHIGLRQPVRLCRSALVEVPTVIGWLKPVVLVPAGALAGLSPAQLEAVLAHELAHIRRHDYLVNLLQRVVETLLFYHPAVWWISRHISQERELCCDDLAVSVCGDRIGYARALATLEELRSPSPNLALAADGGSLLARIRRLSGVSSEPNRSGWWWSGMIALSTVALVIGLLLAVKSLAETNENRPNPQSASQQNTAQETNELPNSPFARPSLERLDAVGRAAYLRALQGELAQTVGAMAGIESARVTMNDSTPKKTASVFVKLAAGETLAPGSVNAIRHFIANAVEGMKAEDVSVADDHGHTYASEKPAAQSHEQPVQNARPAGRAEKILSVAEGEGTSRPPDSSARTNQVRFSPHRARIEEKLDSIVLEEVSFNDVPLAEVVKVLSEEARQRDPDKRGLNFIINSVSANSRYLLNRVGGVSPFGSLDQVLVRVHPPLRNLRLRDVLDVIVIQAASKLRYSVEDYAVVFSSTVPEPEALFTRVFKLNTGAILENLEKTQTRSGHTPASHDSNRPAATLNDRLRQYLVAAGVDAAINGTRSGEFPVSGTGRAVVLNETNGVLFARVTMQELDIIENAMQLLNQVPPHVWFDVKIAELTEHDYRNLGFDWFLGGTATNKNITLRKPPSGPPESPAPASINPVTEPGSNATNQPRALTGVLTEPQLRVLLRTLEQRGGVDILSVPRVTTVSGRQAKIELVEKKTIVTGLALPKDKTDSPSTQAPYATEEVPFGPSIEVVPSVLADGRSIQLTVVASMTEFLGYDDPGPFTVPNVEGNRVVDPPRAMPPLPAIRSHRASTTAVLQPGETLLLGGFASVDTVRFKDKVPVIGDMPLLGRLFRKEGVSERRKNILFFITPSLADPAGNPISVKP